jgi:hypothetical protein
LLKNYCNDVVQAAVFTVFFAEKPQKFERSFGLSFYHFMLSGNWSKVANECPIPALFTAVPDGTPVTPTITP